MSTPAFILRIHSVVRGVDADGYAQVIEDGAILVRNGLIEAIDQADRLISVNADVRIDSEPSCIAIPGLINAHHHSGLTPLQLGVPFAPLELWLPQFMGMRDVDGRLDTLYSAVEMLESGTTTVHHIQGGVFGPSTGWREPADAIIAAYGEIGMKVSYSFMIRDRNQVVFEDDEAFLSNLPPTLANHFGPPLRASLAPVSEMMAFFADLERAWRERAPDSVRVQLAPANLHWCSDRCLDEVFDTARRHGVKLHMHLDETRLQAEFAKVSTGGSAVEHLHSLGLLGPDLTLGHGIWCSEGDLDLLAGHGCSLCHNASSGLRLASGIAPINAARARGLRVALGIDQSGINDDRDMLQEMRVAWMIHREPGLFQDRPQPAGIFKMATEHGAATTGFGDRIGRLDPWRAADIVLIDRGQIAKPYLDERTSLIDALILRAKAKAVRKVFVGGRLVVSEGRVCTIDRDALMAEIEARLAEPLTANEARRRLMVDDLMPHVEHYYRAKGESVTEPNYRFNKLDVRQGSQ